MIGPPPPTDPIARSELVRRLLAAINQGVAIADSYLMEFPELATTKELGDLPISIVHGVALVPPSSSSASVPPG